MSSSSSPTPTFDEALARALDLHRAGDFKGAAEVYRGLLAQRPAAAGIIHLLGLVEQALGRPEEAEALILQALDLEESALFRGNLAFVYHMTKRPDLAEAQYLEALKGDPGSMPVLRNYARLLRDEARWPEALTAFEQVIALAPAEADAHLDLALVLPKLDRADEAEGAYRRTLALAPDHLGALVNLGSLLVNRRRNQAAEELLRQAARAHPGSPEVWGSLGIVLADLGRPTEAEACYRRALALAPEHPTTRLNLGVLLLGQGDFATGWPLFEARHEIGVVRPPLRPSEGCVPWSGEALEGKSLLVLAEQGYGDQMQFVRYAQMARRAGAARVVVAVAPELVGLVRCVPGLDEVASLDSEAPIATDYWACMMSLPRIFGTEAETIARSVPADFPQFHLPAAPGVVRRPRADRIEVGIFWAGRDSTASLADLRSFDDLRSVPFEALRGLLTSPALDGRVHWTLLQKDRRPGDLAALANACGWRDPFADNNPPKDFLETARIVADLDLVIGVDSALIHLAAGLGRATWMMDRFDHCWRWVGDRADSDWYPPLRIFRQPRPGAWTDVLAEVERALLAFRPA